MDAAAASISMPQSPWAAACAAYSERMTLTGEASHAAYFAGFGALHVAVAQELLDRAEEFNGLGERRVVHLENAAGLIAVFSPAQRMVQIRANTTALAQIARSCTIHVRVMPAAAGLLDVASAQGFKTWPLMALYWHFGQAALSAIDRMPTLTTQKLILRRFPAIEPSAVFLRQLQLIHQIGHSESSFEQLLPQLQGDVLTHVCPDLASLYLTGTLRIAAA